jgi:hypothetical protein
MIAIGMKSVPSIPGGYISLGWLEFSASVCSVEPGSVDDVGKIVRILPPNDSWKRVI